MHALLMSTKLFVECCFPCAQFHCRLAGPWVRRRTSHASHTAHRNTQCLSHPHHMCNKQLVCHVFQATKMTAFCSYKSSVFHAWLIAMSALKVKEVYSPSWEFVNRPQTYRSSPAIGSHSVICPTQVIAPRLNRNPCSQVSWCSWFKYPAGMEGWV